jgi:hypothetical protein
MGNRFPAQILFLPKTVGHPAGRYFDTDLHHQLAEFFPVFRRIYRGHIHTDQPAEFFPYAQFIRFFTKVERCLSAHGRQNGIYLIFFQDLFNAFYVEWQQVYRSAIIGSVMMVAGLLLIRITSIPSSRRLRAAWEPE